ncbi:MAG: prepilin-type N-terminal cleavage/methylation domain-containing protein [Sedimentisphaerales bacterium]
MKFRKGFTLIELLIVVLILSALAAIAIPRITQSASNAKKNACDTNVDLINTQIELYTADNNGVAPTSLTTIIGTDSAPTNYFPDGPPKCPYGTEYTLGSNGHVTSHTHTN